MLPGDMVYPGVSNHRDRGNYFDLSVELARKRKEKSRAEGRYEKRIGRPEVPTFMNGS